MRHFVSSAAVSWYIVSLHRATEICSICSIVLIGIFLVPAFVFTGYSGLPVTCVRQMRRKSIMIFGGCIVFAL